VGELWILDRGWFGRDVLGDVESLGKQMEE